jgi:hypothetical protein
LKMEPPESEDSERFPCPFFTSWLGQRKSVLGTFR